MAREKVEKKPVLVYLPMDVYEHLLGRAAAEQVRRKRGLSVGALIVEQVSERARGEMANRAATENSEG